MKDEQLGTGGCGRREQEEEKIICDSTQATLPRCTFQLYFSWKICSVNMNILKDEKVEEIGCSIISGSIISGSIISGSIISGSIISGSIISGSIISGSIISSSIISGSIISGSIISGSIIIT